MEIKKSPAGHAGVYLLFTDIKKIDIIVQISVHCTPWNDFKKERKPAENGE